jgi:peptidyl-prolyl cis-trans isomerase D
MLDNMRTASTSPAGKLVMGLLFSLLAVAFAISFGPGQRGCTGLQSGSVPYAAKVNGEVITDADFERYYYGQIRRFGDMDRAQVDQFFPRTRALEELIADRLVAEEATRHGIGVSDDELRDSIVKNTSFQEDGKFSRDRYELVLERSLGMTEDAFEEEMRRGLRIGKMQSVITEAAKVTDWELEQKFREENEKVSLSFVRFAPAFYASQVTVTDAEIKDFLEKHKDQVSSEYSKESYRFHVPKRVQARHLLVKAAAAADTQARSAVVDARAQLDKGADFAELAKKLSQAGDADKGGLLGMMRQNDHLFDSALETAAFSLDEGKVSQPVKTAQGWELVKVEKVLPAEDKALESVQNDLAKELVTRQKETDLAKKAAEDAQAKLAAGGKMEELFPRPSDDDDSEHKPGEPAKFMPPPDHAAIDSTGLFARSSVGYVPKIGQSIALQQAAFALAAPGAVAKEPFLVADSWVVIALAAHEKPDMAEFAKKKDELRESAEHQAEQQLLQSWRKSLIAQAVVERNSSVIAPMPTKPQS